MTAARGSLPREGRPTEWAGRFTTLVQDAALTFAPSHMRCAARVYRSTLIHLDSWEPIGHPAASLELQRFGISRDQNGFLSAGFQITNKRRPSAKRRDSKIAF